MQFGNRNLGIFFLANAHLNAGKFLVLSATNKKNMFSQNGPSHFGIVSPAMSKTTDGNVSLRRHIDFASPVDSAINMQAEPFSTSKPMEISGTRDSNSGVDTRTPKGRPRRYQLHLWINEREYTLLKSLAESQDEPMSRIVRRLFSYLKHLVDRVDRKAG